MTLPTSRKHSPKKSFKPTALRVPSLLATFAFAIFLIGLLEYAAHKLPLSSKGHESLFAESLLLVDKRNSLPESFPVGGNFSPVVDRMVGLLRRVPEPETSIAESVTGLSVTTSTINNAKSSTSSSAARVVTTTRDVMTVSNTNANLRTTTTHSLNSLPTTLRESGPNPNDNLPTTKQLHVTTALDSALMPPSTGTSGNLETTKASKHVSTSLTVISTIISVTTTDGRGQAVVSMQTSVYTSTTIVAMQTGVAGKYMPAIDILPNNVVSWRHAGLIVFAAGYLPIILSAILQMIWTAIYANVKVIEPFVRLAKSDGAPGRDTLFAYYLSSNTSFTSLSGLIRGNWLMLWSSITYLAVSIIGPLSSEVLFLDMSYECENPDEADPLHRCWPPLFSANPVILRVLQALLAFIAVMTVNIMLMLIRSNTGIHENPTQLSTVISLFRHPGVLADFRQTEPDAPISEYRRRIGKKKYRLDYFNTADGSLHYGVVPMSETNNVNYNAPLPSQYNMKNKSSTRKLDIALDATFAAVLMSILGVIVAYFLDSSNSRFNRFFNSNTFGPRFFMTLVGSIIASNWGRLERYTHVLTIFNQLAEESGRNHATLRRPRNSIPLSALFPQMIHRHFLAATVAFAALLSEVLVIVMAGIPYHPSQIRFELLLCSYLSMAILAVMIITMILVIIWRWRLPHFPRRPNTLGAIVSYICASRFVETGIGEHRPLISDKSGMGVQEMALNNGIIKYGKSRGIDGVERWGINWTS